MMKMISMICKKSAIIDASL